MSHASKCCPLPDCSTLTQAYFTTYNQVVHTKDYNANLKQSLKPIGIYEEVSFRQSSIQCEPTNAEKACRTDRNKIAVNWTAYQLLD